MRTKLASAVVVIGLLVASMTPASAAFGLSKCEKVKKEIRALEKIEKAKILSWNKNWAGKDAVNLVSYRKQSDQEWLYIVNMEVKMYSLERNNPKCFTITQNLYIEKYLPLWQDIKQRIAYGESTNTNGFGVFAKLIWNSIYNQ